jgi:hypothetical protein
MAAIKVQMLSPPSLPEPVVLFIADISGYTRFMTANTKTLAHSHTIIAELVEHLLKGIRLPMEVSKLEGDAILFYCRKKQTEGDWGRQKQDLANRLLSLFTEFNHKLAELKSSVTCNCSACQNIESLQLKVFAHSGEALFHRLGPSDELAGVDVIIIHRLLKNSVASRSYLLLTDAARQDLAFDAATKFHAGMERYDSLDEIRTWVHDLGQGGSPACSPRRSSSHGEFRKIWGILWRLWFSPLTDRAKHYRHIENAPNQASQWLFRILTVLLTPIYLPVAFVKAAVRSLRG